MNRRQVLGLLGGLAGTAAVPTALAQQSGYGPLGRVEIPNTTEAVVSEDGRWAYVAIGTGFAVVDVGDPTAPSVVVRRDDLLAEHRDGPMAGIIDLKIDAHRLVVPGPGNPTRDPVPTGFVLFDVSDPTAPERVAFHESRSPVHNAFLEDDRVYLTQGSAVDVVDIGGDDPHPVGSIELTDFEPDWSDVPVPLRAPHDVWVRDRITYIPMWDAGTLVADASDPDSPTRVAHIASQRPGDLASIPDEEIGRVGTEPPGNHHYAQASADGRLLAIGKESWDASTGDGAGGPSGIELWDLVDPSDPALLSTIHPPRAVNETRRGTWTTAHNFDLVGDRLYSSWYRGGVKVHDVSQPGDPKELAWWRQPEGTAFWTAVQATDGVFVASSAGGYLGPGLTDGLFTFPTEPGEQADPPSSLTPAAAPSRIRTVRRTQASDASPTAAASQPGFGFLTGLTGVGAVLWWRLRNHKNGT